MPDLLIIGVGVVLYALILVHVHQARRFIGQRFDDVDEHTDAIYADTQDNLANILHKLDNISTHLDVAVERIADFEGKPAEVVTVEVPVPVVQETIIQGRGPIAGPAVSGSPETQIFLLLTGAHGKLVAKVPIDKRRRSPQVRWHNRLYAASSETPEGWIYREVIGQ